jgi:hypothetical protein
MEGAPRRGDKGPSNTEKEINAFKNVVHFLSLKYFFSISHGDPKSTRYIVAQFQILFG